MELKSTKSILCLKCTVNLPKTGNKGVKKCLYCLSAGLYAPIEGKVTCQECEAGTECLIGTINPSPCPQGYYCTAGTTAKEACPIGRFGNRTGLKDKPECTYCLAGQYCETEALKDVTGPCNPGYFCFRGAEVSTPPDDPVLDRFWFGECPEGGYYCERGVSQPTPCPPGRFAPGNVGRLESVDDCTLCTAGSYCAVGHQDRVNGTCDPGYFCLEGSPTPRPNTTYGGICPPGFHCPAGSAFPLPCDPGTYNNASGQATCQICPGGFYCSGNTTSPQECPSGFICPPGTSYASDKPCSEGTFNNLTGMSSDSACVQCTAGYYCDRQG